MFKKGYKEVIVVFKLIILVFMFFLFSVEWDCVFKCFGMSLFKNVIVFFFDWKCSV